MTSPNIVIIDTGCANLSSVRMAIERLGVTAQVSKEAAVIRAADKLILPGVGTAKAAMHNLQERGLVELIREAKQPLLAFVWACRCWRRPRRSTWGASLTSTASA